MSFGHLWNGDTGRDEQQSRERSMVITFMLAHVRGHRGARDTRLGAEGAAGNPLPPPGPREPVQAESHINARHEGERALVPRGRRR